ncbi:prenyltransferase/squalene oxidase repeat-containing protein [Aeoliella mucimassa]|uniref:Prenyltransferase and squalene oxidase repeat protein n=1 Tax=Aeoliella mucimassa TaxID=2527972 RepID=A0A518AJW6_9BACT|nr:prenyltransferase/squalene oxidase repeat-containing protein [Aeoliella mucimassa]QDU55005.1 Prenyltransferase and squalene oxidase repeat protein [Aeoliella mucimassa]
MKPLVCTVVLLCLLSQPVMAQEGDTELSAADMMEPAIDSIDRGLAYLAANQNEDGSFRSSNMGRNPAVVALGGMAFLAGGNTPGRGKYGEEVNRTVDFLIANTRADGFITNAEGAGHGPMYGHGFATLFLGEVYGMTPREDLRDSLARSVDLIVRCQNEEGGWRYNPEPLDADISVTICQIMALRAARNAGLHVPKETVDKCEAYVKQCQEPDGGFSYMLQNRGSMFPRSAAGVVALYSAGVYEGPEIEKGLVYVDRFLPDPRQMSRESHYFYGHYYAVQAMWHAGGPRWQRWYPAIRETLVKSQRPDGSWQDSVGADYATAMSCIILQIPNNALPIFQR